MTSRILELSDGKHLCWAEYGDANGKPVFLFHGNPGSRLAWSVMATRLRDLELKEEDKAVFDRPEILELFRLDLPEAYRQSGIGSAYDATIPARWPIPLEEITIRVQLWHAERDPLVGNMTRYLAKHLPRADLKCLAGEGHLWILDHMPEVLAALVE